MRYGGIPLSLDILEVKLIFLKRMYSAENDCFWQP